MIWYPSAEDVICANRVALEASRPYDRHPHRLLGSREGIQTKIDAVKREELKGLIHQAALLMREIVKHHAFAGGNLRTALLVTALFLMENGKELAFDWWISKRSFIWDIENRDVEEIERWIRHGVRGEP